MEKCVRITTAKGSVTTTEEATVNVRDLDMYITVQKTKVFLRMEGKTIAHLDAKWQDHPV